MIENAETQGRGERRVCSELDLLTCGRSAVADPLRPALQIGSIQLELSDHFSLRLCASAFFIGTVNSN